MKMKGNNSVWKGITCVKMFHTKKKKILPAAQAL